MYVLPFIYTLCSGYLRRTKENPVSDADVIFFLIIMDQQFYRSVQHQGTFLSNLSLWNVIKCSFLILNKYLHYSRTEVCPKYCWANAGYTLAWTGRQSVARYTTQIYALCTKTSHIKLWIHFEESKVHQRHLKNIHPPAPRYEFRGTGVSYQIAFAEFLADRFTHFHFVF